MPVWNIWGIFTWLLFPHTNIFEGGLFCVLTCGTSNTFLCSSPQLQIEAPFQGLIAEHPEARRDLFNPCQNNFLGGISPKDLNHDMSPGKQEIPSDAVKFLRVLWGVLFLIF